MVREFKVGDKVEYIGTGNRSKSYVKVGKTYTISHVEGNEIFINFGYADCIYPSIMFRYPNEYLCESIGIK